MRKIHFLFIPTLLFQSCLKNPEVDIQNQKIKDLQEKDVYLMQRIEYQEAKLRELESKIKANPIQKEKKYVNVVSRSKKAKDTLCVKIFEGDIK